MRYIFTPKQLSLIHIINDSITKKQKYVVYTKVSKIFQTDTKNRVFDLFNRLETLRNYLCYIIPEYIYIYIFKKCLNSHNV